MADPVFLLDSNICIYVLSDADGPAARRLGRCRSGEAVTSSIVLAEVMRGIPPHEAAANASARSFFELVKVLPFDERAAFTYARLPFRRGTFDRLIAAHALAHGLTLVTNNLVDFDNVPDLRAENWAKAA